MKNNNITTIVKNNRTFAVQQEKEGFTLYIELPEANSLDADSICEKYEKMVQGEVFWCEAYFPWENPFKKENRNVVLGWCVWPEKNSQVSASSLLAGLVEAASSFLG